MRASSTPSSLRTIAGRNGQIVLIVHGSSRLRKITGITSRGSPATGFTLLSARASHLLGAAPSRRAAAAWDAAVVIDGDA